MTYPRLGFAAIMVATLAACAETAGPGTTLVTRIDRASLDSTGLLAVSFTITNMGLRPEDVGACGGRPSPVFEKRRAESWASFGGGACLAILSQVPISLKAGASIADNTGIVPGEPGVYRLVVSYEVDGSPRAVSPPFTVQ